MQKKGVIFLGQKPLGEDCFNILIRELDNNWELRAVVTNTITDNWRGVSNIANWAKKKKVILISNEMRNEDKIYSVIKAKNISVMLSVQHPWILSGRVLRTVRMAFNLHNAKLPNYKGYNSINHAILNREKYYTSTIHWMIERVDMGPIAFEERVAIKKGETAKSLHKRAHKVALKVFRKLITALNVEVKIPSKEIKMSGTFYKKTDLEVFREIQNLNNLEEVERKARAFYNPPFDPAYFKISSQKFYIVPAEKKRKELIATKAN